jgi:hypothetical protein
MTLLARTQLARAGRGGPMVVQKGGTLYVNGTRGDERLVIHHSGAEVASGEIEVWDLGASPAVVLGVYSGVDDINVQLLEGDNFLGLYNFWLTGDVVVTAGDGNNQVNVGGVGDESYTAIKELSVTTGAGFDLVRIEKCDIKTATINTGDGADMVLTGHALQPEYGNSNSYVGTCNVNTGDGDDYVAMLDMEDSYTTVDTGAGDDWVLLGVGFEDGDWKIDGCYFFELSVMTGTGADLVVLVDSLVAGGVGIATEHHGDELQLGGFGAPNTFAGDVMADGGGGGNDKLYDDPANSYASTPEFINFETISP